MSALVISPNVLGAVFGSATANSQATSAASALLWLGAATIAGRIGLYLLPAGEAGARRALDPVGSLAPGALLGLSLLSWGDQLVEGLGAVALVALAAIACLLRAAGIGGLVPRHERFEAPPPAALRSVSWLAWVGTLVLAGQAATDPAARALVASVMLSLVVEGAAQRGGLAPIPRRAWSLAVLIAAVTTAESGAVHSDDFTAFAILAAALCVAVGWVRRGDRRDLWLATAGIAGCGAPLFGTLAAGILLLCTPRPVLARTAMVVALVGLWLAAFITEEPARHASTVQSSIAGAVAVTLGGLALLWARRRDVRRVGTHAVSRTEVA